MFLTESVDDHDDFKFLEVQIEFSANVAQHPPSRRSVALYYFSERLIFDVYSVGCLRDVKT